MTCARPRTRAPHLIQEALRSGVLFGSGYSAAKIVRTEQVTMGTTLVCAISFVMGGLYLYLVRAKR